MADPGGLEPPVLGRLAMFVAIGMGISVLARRLKDARTLAEQRAVLANARADELALARADAERHARDAVRRAEELDVLFNVSPVGIARADLAHRGQHTAGDARPQAGAIGARQRPAGRRGTRSSRERRSEKVTRS